MEYYSYCTWRNVTLIAPAMADPGHELKGWGAGFVLLALLASLPSVSFFLYPKEEDLGPPEPLP